MYLCLKYSNVINLGCQVSAKYPSQKYLKNQEVAEKNEVLEKTDIVFFLIFFQPLHGKINNTHIFSLPIRLPFALIILTIQRTIDMFL